MSDTELSVICRECGSEVSPYVTECPYCGSRVRKRAPELEHHDDHFQAKPPVRRRLSRRLPRLRRRRLKSAGLATVDAGEGYAVGAYLLASAVLMVIAVAAGLSLSGIGAVAGPLDGQWWRLASAQLAYDNVGYLLAVGITLAIFGVGIERRLGPGRTIGMLLLAGTAGTAVGYGAETALGADGPLIAGGNSVALASVMAWLVLRRGEAKRSIGGGEPVDVIGVGVVVCALLLLPLLESSADVFSGLGGAAFGGLAGLLFSVLRRR